MSEINYTDLIIKSYLSCLYNILVNYFSLPFLQAEILLLLWWITHVIADVLVFTKLHHELDLEFQDVPARFGTPIPSEGMRVSTNVSLKSQIKKYRLIL